MTTDTQGLTTGQKRLEHDRDSRLADVALSVANRLENLSNAMVKRRNGGFSPSSAWFSGDAMHELATELRTAVLNRSVPIRESDGNGVLAGLSLPGPGLCAVVDGEPLTCEFAGPVDIDIGENGAG